VLCCADPCWCGRLVSCYHCCGVAGPGSVISSQCGPCYTCSRWLRLGVAFAACLGLLGLCSPLLINSHSLKQRRTPFARHGPPGPAGPAGPPLPLCLDEPRTDTSLSLQTVITAITAIAIASADLKPVVCPSGSGKQARVRGIPTLGPRKFQQRRLSVPPTLPNLAFTRDLPTPRD
jgi:hypothetical protein